MLQERCQRVLYNGQENGHNRFQNIEGQSNYNKNTNEDDSSEFSLKAFLIALSWGPVILGFPINFRPNYKSARKRKHYYRADEASVEDEATVEDEPIVENGYVPTREIGWEAFKVVMKK